MAHTVIEHREITRVILASDLHAAVTEALNGREHTRYVYSHGPLAIKGLPKGKRLAITFSFEPDPNADLLEMVVSLGDRQEQPQCPPYPEMNSEIEALNSNLHTALERIKATEAENEKLMRLWSDLLVRNDSLSAENQHLQTAAADVMAENLRLVGEVERLRKLLAEWLAPYDGMDADEFIPRVAAQIKETRQTLEASGREESK